MTDDPDARQRIVDHEIDMAAGIAEELAKNIRYGHRIGSKQAVIESFEVAYTALLSRQHSIDKYWVDNVQP